MSTAMTTPGLNATVNGLSTGCAPDLALGILTIYRSTVEVGTAITVEKGQRVDEFFVRVRRAGTISAEFPYTTQNGARASFERNVERHVEGLPLQA